MQVEPLRRIILHSLASNVIIINIRKHRPVILRMEIWYPCIILASIVGAIILPGTKIIHVTLSSPGRGRASRYIPLIRDPPPKEPVEPVAETVGVPRQLRLPAGPCPGGLRRSGSCDR